MFLYREREEVYRRNGESRQKTGKKRISLKTVLSRYYFRFITTCRVGIMYKLTFEKRVWIVKQ